jgi:HSP20 family molecular chaperone IbpA
MTTTEELQVQEKQELDKPEESTMPARYFVPHADIFENEDSLTIVMEMPGVGKDHVTIDVEDDRLSIEGKIDFSRYEDIEPIYTEYSVGHYKRAFTLSDKIDQGKINASLVDGVLTLVMLKAEAAKPRRIEIS